MLSSVSKLADKAFVLGFLLPSLLAIVTFVNAISCPPWMSGLCETLSTDNPFANLTYLVLIVYAFAVLLVALNNTIYRLYEGYFTPVPRLRKVFVLFQAWKYDRLNARYTKLRTEKSFEASLLKLRMLDSYPSDAAKLLPTSLGNAIKAFELYSLEVYGADSIPIWSRLLSVIPKDYIDETNSARSLVDFALNVSLLSMILAICSGMRLLGSLFHVGDSGYPFTELQSLIITASLALVSWFAYLLAIARAKWWGSMVKSAFDCYLVQLSIQLGYTLPAKAEERREFWKEISKCFLYRQNAP